MIAKQGTKTVAYIYNVPPLPQSSFSQDRTIHLVSSANSFYPSNAVKRAITLAVTLIEGLTLE